VHIADVAQYVKEGSFLDQTPTTAAPAFTFPTGRIPMLPKRFRTHLSLNPKVDRLTITCEMDLNAGGAVTRYDLYESVISSDERMTYTAVRKILADCDPALRRRYAALVPRFELMAELMEAMRAKKDPPREHRL